MSFMFEQIKEQARNAVKELCETAKLKKGSIFIVGCSTSEIAGHKIGSDSNPELAQAVFEGIYEVLKNKGIFLAAQCCEHLNRAVIIERDALINAEIVNVIPQPKAGGSFATAAYKSFSCPAAVEKIRADAGIDIGGTLIGMHLKEVAVPVRLTAAQIGQANVIAARTRPKFIGGIRAVYNDDLF